MIIDVPDRDIFVLSLDYNTDTSLFWCEFADLVCECVDVDDIDQCIENFRKELLKNETGN